jgi:hypothetical protein
MKDTDKTTYEVYTYFGRVVETIKVEPNTLHIDALEDAQWACANYIKTTGQDAWVRLV